MGLNYADFKLLKATNCIASSTFNNSCNLLMLGRLKVTLSENQKKNCSKEFNLDLNSFSGYAEKLLLEMGCTGVKSLDYSDFEGSDIVWNLNQSIFQSPSNSELMDTYDIILDFGTTEHVFNPAQSVANSISMLKKNGRLVITLPITGSVDHGLYQFAPNWFYAMESESFKLERLYFFENQSKRNKILIWDGLDINFQEHIDGTFDGSYRASLFQYLNAPIYSFAIFQKKDNINEKDFVENTHQRLYANWWKGKFQHLDNKKSFKNELKNFIHNNLNSLFKHSIYKNYIKNKSININSISPLD